MKGTLPETFWFTKTITLDDVVCLKEKGARPQVADERTYVPPGSPSEPYETIIIIIIIIIILIVIMIIIIKIIIMIIIIIIITRYYEQCGGGLCD